MAFKFLDKSTTQTRHQWPGPMAPVRPLFFPLCSVVCLAIGLGYWVLEEFPRTPPFSVSPCTVYLPFCCFFLSCSCTFFSLLCFCSIFFAKYSSPRCVLSFAVQLPSARKLKGATSELSLWLAAQTHTHGSNLMLLLMFDLMYLVNGCWVRHPRINWSVGRRSMLT